MSVTELDADGIRQVLGEAIGSTAEVTVIVHHEAGWLSFRSHLVAVGASRLTLLLPMPHDPRVDFRFRPQLRIGINLRMHSRKLVFSTTVHDTGLPLAKGPLTATSIVTAMPSSARLISNRLYERINVPAGRRASVMFWPGGLDVPLSDDAPETPVWVGELTDLSIGGFGIRAAREAGVILHVGDLVGTITSFDDMSILRSNAHLSHAEVRHDADTFYGLRFSSLGRTIQEQLAMTTLEQKLREFAA